jgi:hypothetical protein
VALKRGGRDCERATSAEQISERLDRLDARLQEIVDEVMELATLHPELGLNNLKRNLDPIARAERAPARLAELATERDALIEERRRLKREYVRLPKSVKR